ncbi:MAG: tyrosine-type recombinase/integrase [Thiogranum sp.]
MTKRKPLTDLAIRKAKPGTWLADPECRGLRIYIQSGGIATWFYRFRSLTRKGPDGKPTLDTVKLGIYPAVELAEARMKWREMKSARGMGKDPKAPATQKAPITVAELVDAYINGYAKRMKKSWRNDDRILEKDILPRVGGQPAALSRNGAKEVLAEVADRGDQAASQLLAVCRKTWNYGIEEGYVRLNPFQRLKIINGVVMASDTKVKRTKKPKEYLDDLALQSLLRWMPASEIPLQAQQMVRLQLLTACRPGEICGAEWCEIDFARNTWTIPPEKHKAERGHIVMLSEQSVHLLQELKQTAAGDYVFPSRQDVREPCRYEWYHHQWKRYVEAGPVKYVTPHALRHSVITGLAALRCPSEVCTRIAGHAATGVTETVYTHHQRNEEAAEWLQKWADHLDALQTDGVAVLKAG